MTPNSLTVIPQDSIYRFYKNKYRSNYRSQCRMTSTIINNLTPEHLKELFYTKISNKAPGIDLYTRKLISKLPDNLFTLLQMLFIKMLTDNAVPEVWKVGLTVLIYKKGDLLDISNYRPITMLSLFRKLFEYLLLDEFNNFENYMHPSQIGFVKNKDCYFGLLTLDLILSQKKYRRLKNCSSAITFIDIKAAYDTVPLIKIWTYLESKGFGTAILQSLFNFNKIQLMNIDISYGFLDLERGVPQGAVISPALFNIFIASFIDSLDSLLASNLPYYPFSLICYADDIVFLCKSITQMRAILNSFSNFLTTNQMSVSAPKCGSFCSDSLSIQHQTIPLISSYKYLGIPFDKKGICQKELLQLISTKITKCLSQSCFFGFASHSTNTYSAGLYFKTFLRSTLEYYLCLVNKTNLHRIKSIIYSYLQKYFKTKRRIN